MANKKNKKHFIIYYKKGTGTFIVTEPRPWARENMMYFDSPEPKTKEIEAFLIEKLNFKKQEFNEDKISVLINLDPNADL